jgi:simple sugar transport system ATP-binding protein
MDLGSPWDEAAALPVGLRQRLEFARALSRDPDLLILDEPTAVLAPPEVESFGGSVRSAAARGTAVVFITHRLPEVFGLADRISLLRKGRVVFTRPARETSPSEIAAEFLGPAEKRAPSEKPEPGAEVLAVEELSGTGIPGPLSLSIAQREIVAIVGVDGNGQDALTRLVAGLERPSRGKISLGGIDLGGQTLRRAGAGVIPGDRQSEGLILDFSIEENLRLVEPVGAPAPERAAEIVREFAVVAPSVDVKARFLSGGNQQKLVLGRELSRRPKFLLAVQPTRGLDLSATRMTFDALAAARDADAAILLITSDLDEARELGNRLFVLYRGALSGPFDPRASAETLGRGMAGLE